jgi:hypothetical protein
VSEVGHEVVDGVVGGDVLDGNAVVETRGVGVAVLGALVVGVLVVVVGVFVVVSAIVVGTFVVDVKLGVGVGEQFIIVDCPVELSYLTNSTLLHPNG